MKKFIIVALGITGSLLFGIAGAMAAPSAPELDEGRTVNTSIIDEGRTLPGNEIDPVFEAGIFEVFEASRTPEFE